MGKELNVQELIDELNKIEDKTIKVYYYDDERYGNLEVEKIEEGHSFYSLEDRVLLS